ncbi:MAG: hypothetical protein EPO08_08985 [Rhodospirillaceae bacterium]|nr:MAG: hypothetical protein EPO08_08985 [Rhodospirillaceae bacterium]
MVADFPGLRALIETEAKRPLPVTVTACTSYLRHRFGATTAGILFYGAGIRGVDPQTLLDFYVIVDDPYAALNSAWAGLAAVVLPPNVYLVEVPLPGGIVCAKVAVIGRRAFFAGTTAFSSHLWGRFAQPTIIAYARDRMIREDLIMALMTSARSMMTRTLPLMPSRFTARSLWARSLQECYAAELRPERAGRADVLVAENETRYETMTAAVLGPPDGDGCFKRPTAVHPAQARIGWWFRRRWGKTTNLLRLMKAAFTFSGGLDYAVAKIARHTGVKVEITDKDRRHPLLAGIRVFLEARRRGGVR